MKHLACALVFVLVTSCRLLPQDRPVQDVDYAYEKTTEEKGEDYYLISYYLQNLKGEKLYFYNFRITGGKENIIEIRKALPADVVILEPFRKAKFLVVKVARDDLGIEWNADFMYHAIGATGVPEINREYVFFLRSADSGTLTNYDYYIKNIGDKRIVLHDFSLGQDAGSHQVVAGLPAGRITLDPEEVAGFYSFSVEKGATTPTVNWYADFTTFQWNNDEFCQGVIRILEASREKEFADIKGDPSGRASSLYRSTCYQSKINVEGMSNLCIEKLSQGWCFVGQVGDPADKGDIVKRYKEVKDRLVLCIPAMMTETKLKEEALNGTGTAYKGIVNNLVHQLKVFYCPSPDAPGLFALFVIVEEAY
jgi:hypothetical protein